VGCPETRKAVLIDPVLETIERDLATLQKLELELDYTLDTHMPIM
jgi:sulfur dioxygenase